MRIAAIDIGTNTVLMLMADVGDGVVRRVVRDEHAIARLGQGVDRERRIHPDAIDRVAAILRQYREICEQEEVDQIVACGTSAFRDAVNQEDVVSTLRSHTGIAVRVLNAETEAVLTYRGTTTTGSAEGSPERVAVLDIGGGSTEIITGEGDSILSTVSVELGAVRITERFLTTSPPLPRDLLTADRFCRESFRNATGLRPAARCVAVAGTPTTLAALALRLPTYDRSLIEGFVLSRAIIEDLFERLKGLSLAQLAQIPQIHPQRADILVAGILILRAYLDVTGTAAVSVSDRGLRYGILLDALRRPSSS